MNFFKKLFSWGKKSTQEKDKIEKESVSEAENEDVILKESKKVIKKEPEPEPEPESEPEPEPEQ